MVDALGALALTLGASATTAPRKTQAEPTATFNPDDGSPEPNCSSPSIGGCKGHAWVVLFWSLYT